MIKYSNEIQIEIDDVYGCPGHCPGCVLSNLERKGFSPDMNMETLINSINQLKKYVPTLKNLEKINITYGIADHFLMDDEYLEKTYHLAADVIEQSGLKNQYNGVFYTASMIGKHTPLMERIKKLNDVSKKRGVPFYILAVLDPKNLYHKKFSEVYSNNIIKANELLGKVDLSINLSEEAITTITPKELFEFAKVNHFDEVTINWTPTFDNLPFVYMNQEFLFNWLTEFDRLLTVEDKIGTSYRPVILKTINNLKCKDLTGATSFSDNINYNLPELTHKSIQIDEKGNVFPKYEAIGDIAHTPRLGFNPIGNVNQLETIAEMFKKNDGNIKKTVLKQFNNKLCSTCEYNNYCANTGFHIYSYVLEQGAKKDVNVKLMLDKNKKEMGCPHIAKKMFKYYEDQAFDPEFKED